MSDTYEFWTGVGSFGNAYHQRNRVNWRLRAGFWGEILQLTGARSVFELGCGPGWNLSAITGTGDYPIKTYGCDYNEVAIQQAKNAGHDVWKGPYLGHRTPSFDLTFTAGCLIHVPPEELQPTMQRLVDASAQWVLAVEYYAQQEEEVEYRGHKGKLWKRPYGNLYQDMGLIPRGSGGLGWEDGFGEGCSWWLFEHSVPAD